MSYKTIIINPDDVLVGNVDDNSIRPIEHSYNVCGLKFKSQEELMDICARAAKWDRLVKLVVDEEFIESLTDYPAECKAVLQEAIQKVEAER